MKLKSFNMILVFFLIIAMTGMGVVPIATGSVSAIIPAQYIPPEEVLKETVAIVINNPDIQDKSEYLYLVHIQNAKDLVAQGKPKAAKVQLENFIRFVIQDWVDGTIDQTLSQVLIYMAEDVISKLSH